MMAEVEDDDNVTFAVLLYAHIIAREEEDKQQPDPPQPNHKGPGELQSGSADCDHGSQRRGEGTTAWPVLQPPRHTQGY